MKIATWNSDRLKSTKNISAIGKSIEVIDAAILILTECDTTLKLPMYNYKIETQKLPEKLYNYKETARRVCTFSKFPIIRIVTTYDEMTSCCAEFETPYGNLIVYGTVVGIIGNTDKNFKIDLLKQLEDLHLISKLGHFCYGGDLNISFFDNYYFTNFGRINFRESFKNNKLKILTEFIPENIDHIVLSEDFIKNCTYKASEWNTDKKLSDHKGICIELRKCTKVV